MTDNLYCYIIDTDALEQFQIQPDYDTLNIPYDYDSILHYGVTTFSKDFRLRTITPKDPNIAFSRLGQNTKLSTADILHVNRRYCGGKYH